MRNITWVGGAATLAAYVTLAVTQANLGSPLFFALSAIAFVVYGFLVAALLSSEATGRSSDLPPDQPPPTLRRSAEALRATAEGGSHGNPRKLPRLLVGALLLAAAFRVPLAVSPVGWDNDMVRYVYDGRLQRLGYNPFSFIPSDPAVAGTHDDMTRRMPSRNARTPYPAAAQLFFRAVVTLSEDLRVMKCALVACDLLTIAVLVAWLRSTRRSPYLALLYAWNPLVILEVAHSGHIDALGGLWIAVSAWMLSVGRGMPAAIAFVLAVASKLLPIVLVPLYWKRIRIRDAAIAALVLAALYLPFSSAGLLPLGAVPNVVAFIRFNGPLFKFLAAQFTPQGAAAVAVLAGLAVAAWMRWRTTADDPAAWAWPMAISLAAAPVIYPWYLLYFTPFLFTRATVPLIVWTFTTLPVYLVWHLSRDGYRWIVPTRVLWFEFGSVALVLVALTVLKVLKVRAGARGAGAKGAEGAA